MDTAHVTLPHDQLKDMRLHVTLDDGSHFPIEDNKSYAAQNTGAGVICVAERAASRGEPDLATNDCSVIGNREWLKIDVKPDTNYYAWSRGQDSVMGVGLI